MQANLSDIPTGDIWIVSNDEEEGNVCGAAEKRQSIKKWKWSHLNEVRPQCECY